MRALVTGGCGFIGSNLVHQLVKDGWVVDIVDDLSNGYIEHLSPLNIRCVTGPLSKFYNRSNDPKNPDVLVISEIYLTPEFRHSGLGSIAIKETIDHLVKSACVVAIFVSPAQ